MRNTERAQLCNLLHITLGLKQDNINVSSSLDHSFSFLSSLICSSEPPSSCQKGSTDLADPCRNARAHELEVSSMLFVLASPKIAVLMLLINGKSYSSWCRVSRFNPSRQLSPTQPLAHSPWWDGGDNQKGKSEKACGLR